MPAAPRERDRDNRGLDFRDARTRDDCLSICMEFGFYAGYRSVVAGMAFDADWGLRWKCGDELTQAQIYYEIGREVAVHMREARRLVRWVEPNHIPAAIVDFMARLI